MPKIFNATNPKILKTMKIEGEHIDFHNATETDAEFILSIRSRKGRFLSKTKESLTIQQEWIRKYSESDDQAYFVIKNRKKEPVGTIRLYDQQNDSICWGSWIIEDNMPNYYSLESAMILYTYCLSLGFYKFHFDVRNKNLSVKKFHERFGATITKIDEINTYYKLEFNELYKSIKRYRKFLPNGIRIID